MYIIITTVNCIGAWIHDPNVNIVLGVHVYIIFIYV